MKEAEMEQVANFLDEGVELAASIKASIERDTGKAVPIKVHVSLTIQLGITIDRDKHNLPLYNNYVLCEHCKQF